MRTFAADLRYAARSLTRSPFLALTAIFAMAMGIGLTTTIYGVIDAALLRGLPFPDGDRIVAITRALPDNPEARMGIPARDYLELAARQRTLDGVGAYSEREMNLSGDERPERVSGARLSGNTFALIRAQPALGRTFTADDDRPGAPLTAIISSELWSSRFGGDARILGRTIKVDGEAATVVGVMPRGFGFPNSARLWTPLRLDPAAYATDRGEWLDVFGKLRAGQSEAAASREISATYSAITKNEIVTEPMERKARVDVAEFTRAFMGPDASMLWTMLGAVVLVLVVACVNVANLLLSRAAERTREIGVRTALGAGRARVVAMFFAESAALAIVGAAAGIATAWGGMRIFSNAVADTSPPFWLVLHLDGRILLFVVAATAVAAIVAGSLPALKASRVDASSLIGDGSRGSTGIRVGRTSRTLVIVEVALSGALLVAAGLMIATMSKLRTRDYGVDTRTVVAGRVLLSAQRYGDSLAVPRFVADLEGRLRAGGVQHVALATSIPVVDGTMMQRMHVEGEPEVDGPRGMSLRVSVTPGLFDAVGARAVRGRDFDERDAAGAPDVALVNGAWLRAHMPSGDPIGHRAVLELGSGKTRTVTIVGVAPDIFPGSASTRAMQEAIYVPLAQWPSRSLALIVRPPTGYADPLAIAAPMRDAVRAIDPDLALSDVNTLGAHIYRRTWFYRVFGTVFTVFGAVALFLASLGLYAMMAAAVARRTREMGIRIALGADPMRVLRMILAQGGLQIAIGSAFGLALGLGLSQLVRGLLFGVKPGDPLVTLGVLGVLALTGIAACIVPALRASRVQPMVALRSE